MTPKLFKQLLIAWWILGIVSIVVTLLTERYLPIELIAYLDSVAETEPSFVEWTALFVGFILFVAMIVASFGVFIFKPWGRMLFLWSNVFVLPLSPIFGPSVLSGWAVTVGFAWSVLTGGVLFTMYLPPISYLIEQGKYE